VGVWLAAKGRFDIGNSDIDLQPSVNMFASLGEPSAEKILPHRNNRGTERGHEVYDALQD
jgi:hypothetical protein